MIMPRLITDELPHYFKQITSLPDGAPPIQAWRCHATNFRCLNSGLEALDKGSSGLALLFMDTGQSHSEGDWINLAHNDLMDSVA